MRTNVNDFALTSIEETQKAIQIVKKRIELREQMLEERVLQLPKEVLKAGVSMIIPAFISSKIKLVYCHLFLAIKPHYLKILSNKWVSLDC